MFVLAPVAAVGVVSLAFDDTQFGDPAHSEWACSDVVEACTGGVDTKTDKELVVNVAAAFAAHGEAAGNAVAAGTVDAVDLVLAFEAAVSTDIGERVEGNTVDNSEILAARVGAAVPEDVATVEALAPH